MKKLLTLALSAILLCAPALAEVSVMPTGTGVKVLSAANWAETYPEIYASYQKNAENDRVIDHVAEYPMIATVYEGMAFNAYYGSARGHVYTITDVTSTGRPHKLANCFTCKTPDFTNAVNNEGVAAYQMPFEDMLARVNEPISCYNCHANEPGKAVVTHTYLSDAMGADLSQLKGGTASCAQCHVEYYFDPQTKATTLPYDSLAAMNPDSILAFFDEMDFADYTNPRTGVRQIKVQHPEFETFMGEGSAHRNMFTCADCHMGTEKAEDGTAYKSHYWVSPLQSEAISATCAACHEDLTGKVRAIQEHAEARTIAIGNKLEDLTNRLAAAVEGGSLPETDLEALRALNRSGQFYWDFVFVENSEGAHNSKLTEACLDKAEALVDEALSMLV